MKRSIQMPVGVAKAGRIHDHLRDLERSGVPRKMVPEYIDYISRAEIEHCDISRLLGNFGPEADADELRRIQGKLLIAVEGYDESPEELIEIPAVRRFFQFASETWPYWLFTGSIFSPNLMAVTLAVLPEVTIVRREDAVFVHYDPSDMQAFLQKALPAAAWLHDKVGTSKQKGLQQLRAAAAYLGLEF